LNYKNVPLLFLIVTLIFVFSCDGGNMPGTKPIFKALQDIPAATWDKLSKKKIFFGHQSVGFNIIDDLKDLMKHNTLIIQDG